MSIITFCSNESKETGQTLSMAAIATYMAIEHNYKILLVSTNFNDLTLENCFWEYNKIRPTGAIQTGTRNVGLDSGVESLIKVLNSNKTSNEIVKNYSRIILKDRLDILLAPVARRYQEYIEITPYYTDILTIANRYYDYIFVDLGKKMPTENINSILEMSDMVIVNITQRLKNINDFVRLRESNDFYKRNNVLINIGRYDKFSKYNQKNVTRYIKEKNLLFVVPYNTLFFEACSEGTLIEYLLKVKNVKDESDRNYVFIQEIKSIVNQIITKLQELKTRI